MDLNYNLLKLDKKIDEIFKNLIGKKNNKISKQLVDDLISKKDSDLIDNETRKFLNGYSKDAISLAVEKRILLAIENKSLANRKSYWLALKDRAPRINRGILSHYYDDFVEDVNNEFVRYKTRTIDEINKVYDNEIKNNLEVKSEEINDVLNNISNINLDHMENLNANGRTLSVNGVKKGGLFLSKDSNISYGKFVNKDEFINIISKMETNKFKTNNGELTKEELEKIVSKISQKVNISKNEKITNQDARSITIGNEEKKAGTLFFGKKGLDLPNGVYVSVDEMNAAINEFLNEKKELTIKKEDNKRVFKVTKIQSKVKRFAAAAALAVSLLVASVSGKKDNIISTLVTQETQSNDVDQTINSFEQTISLAQSNNEIKGVESQTISNPLDIFNQNLNDVVANNEQLEKVNENLIQPINNAIGSVLNNVVSEPTNEKVKESTNISGEEMVLENNVVSEPTNEEVNESTNISREEMVLENNVVSEPTNEEVNESTNISREEMVLENNVVSEPTNEEVKESTNISGEEMVLENNVVSEPTNEEVNESTNISSEETVSENNIEENEITTEEVKEVATMQAEKTVSENNDTNEILRVEEPMKEETNIVSESQNEIADNVPDSNINTGVTGTSILNYAMQFVGQPYLHGGSWDGSENYTATDCSGFVHGVYEHFGIEVPRSSAELRQSGGINIGTDISVAQPGDIICFDGHVGIYAGDGQMVHASGKSYGVKHSEIKRPILAIVRSPYLIQSTNEYGRSR